MDKDERNRRRREQYGKAKEAGLSRSQARSVKKAVQKDPGLASSITGLFAGVIRDLEKAIDQTGKQLTKNPKEKAPKQPRPSKSSTRKKKAGAAKQTLPDFDVFAAARGQMSMRKIKAEYRKLGGKISNEKAAKAVREVYGVEKDIKKKHRIKYLKASDRSWRVGGENVPKKTYYKRGYAYIVKYQAVRAGMLEPETMYATITHDTKLTVEEVKDSLYMMFDDLAQAGEAEYNMEEIVEESIEILYAIDNSK